MCRSDRSNKRQRKGAANGGGGNALVWLRQDLRLHDNETIAAAAKFASAGGGQLAFVYVHSPAEDGDAIRTGGLRRTLYRGCRQREMPLACVRRLMLMCDFQPIQPLQSAGCCDRRVFWPSRHVMAP